METNWLKARLLVAIAIEAEIPIFENALRLQETGIAAESAVVRSEIFVLSVWISSKGERVYKNFANGRIAQMNFYRV